MAIHGMEKNKVVEVIIPRDHVDAVAAPLFMAISPFFNNLHHSGNDGVGFDHSCKLDSMKKLEVQLCHSRRLLKRLCRKALPNFVEWFDVVTGVADYHNSNDPSDNGSLWDI